ncbi:MAG: deoxyribose-phosphate aldolase [Oscillospiraceae bacterium]|nr:deoxyribose-phosphate aldolase [Oscillospiraceae bacterium]
MTHQDILAHVDHTLLATTATWEQIRTLCDEGMHFQTASVCIPPSYVKQASDYVAGRLKVCTVIGFPNGYNATSVKVFEAERAVRDGAEEIDMVINLGMVKQGDWAGVTEEIRAVKASCKGRVLKVIVEACQLTQEEKVAACHAVSEAGADFIKTSTGFSTGGATLVDVALFRATVAPHVQVKAAGGIRTWEDARAYLELGASRLGTSALVALAKQEEK